MNLHKVWLIARREFSYNVRRRSFLFTAFLVPLLSIGISIFSSGLATSSLDDVGTYTRIGIVDRVGIFKGYTPPKPYEVLTLEQAQAAVSAKALDVYYVLPADYITRRRAESYSTASLPPGLNADVSRVIRIALSAQLGNADLIARLQNPSEKVEVRQADNPQKFNSTVFFSSFYAPFIFAMILFLSVMTTSQFVLSGVVEEKENRMMEVFTTSSRPSEMLWGKVLGLGALGLLQLVIWIGVGIVVLLANGIENAGTTLASINLSPGTVLLMLAYFLLGYLFNGMLMGAIGATVDSEKESRQIIGVLSIIYIIPLIFLIGFITDSNGTIPTALSLFPLTAPTSMILRVTLGQTPDWQVALSMVILFASTALVAWSAGRIFRIGMLSYGKRMGFRDIFRALRGGQLIRPPFTAKGGAK